VAARTIYAKFGGKLGLFEAVVAHERDRMMDNWMNSCRTSVRWPSCCTTSAPAIWRW
jgi:hypothetical protein